MKDKINKLKNDKESLNLYVKLFLEGKKTKDKLSNNEEFNNLKDKMNKDRF